MVDGFDFGPYEVHGCGACLGGFEAVFYGALLGAVCGVEGLGKCEYGVYFCLCVAGCNELALVFYGGVAKLLHEGLYVVLVAAHLVIVVVAEHVVAGGIVWKGFFDEVFGLLKM